MDVLEDGHEGDENRSREGGFGIQNYWAEDSSRLGRDVMEPTRGGPYVPTEAQECKRGMSVEVVDRR